MMWCLHLDFPTCAWSSFPVQPLVSKKACRGNLNCFNAITISVRDKVGFRSAHADIDSAVSVKRDSKWWHLRANLSIKKIALSESVFKQRRYHTSGNALGFRSPALYRKQLQRSGFLTSVRQSNRQLRCRQGCAICFRSSITRHLAAPKASCISCTTFNILAPIYKRVNGENCRESQFREFWLSRNERILEMLIWKNSSIICLQEFWLGNKELVTLYEQNLGSAGYEMLRLARTNNRGDGLLTAIKKDELLVVDHRELLFHDCGDRVAQIIRLQSAASQDRVSQNSCSLQEMILVNTHLLFPHNSNYSLARLRQVHTILRYLDDYKAEHRLFSVPIVLCGDWNGSKKGQVYKFLRSQGFISSYDQVRRLKDNDPDAHQWVSHRNHRGNICGVDFIWLLNPTKNLPPLMKSFKQAVFGIIQSKLQEAGLKERDAFCFFKAENKCHDNVSLQDFHQALKELGLTDEEIEGLSREEVEDLMLTADFDGNGVLDYEEFTVALSFQSSEQTSEENRQLSASTQASSPVVMPKNACDPLKMTVSESVSQKSWFPGRLEAELDVMDAFLYPPEVEQGEWPEDYSLSDHAPLTAIFTPICTVCHTAAS